MANIPISLSIPDEMLIPGPQGPQGDQGIQGPQGPPGSSAANGPNILDYAGATTGNAQDALNAALADCISGGYRKITVPVGWFDMSAAPNPITHGVRLVGENPSQSVLRKTYNGDGLVFNGSGGMGGGVSNMAIYAGTGTTSGSALKLVASSTESPDYCWHENVVITGAGSWQYGLLVDGIARSSPAGLRDTHFKNLNIFACTSAPAYLRKAIGAVFNGLGCFPAGGANGNLYVADGSDSVMIHGGNINGEMNLVNCSRVVFSGAIGSLNTAASAVKCHISGTCSGAIYNNMTNSRVDFP